MAKQNAQLVTETAAILLAQIQRSSEDSTNPDHLKALSEAFALVAQYDSDAPPPAPIVGRNR